MQCIVIFARAAKRGSLSTSLSFQLGLLEAFI